MRDTLEHELYSRNYTNENIKQLEMNFDAVDNYGVQVSRCNNIHVCVCVYIYIYIYIYIYSIYTKMLTRNQF